MTTGIYQLKFKSGKKYFGQALDIKSRYNDHINSMKKGTASRKMQAEYDKYGVPELELVIECNPAYLTYLENYVIYYNYNDECLNTSTPREAPALIDDKFLLRFAKLSPSSMSDKIVELEHKLSSSMTYCNNLKTLLDKALIDRDRETLEADVDGLVKKEREFWINRVNLILDEQKKPKKFLDRLRILFKGN